MIPIPFALSLKGYDEFVFSSVQPATINQVTFNYKIPSGNSIWINWGTGADVLLTANNIQNNITSTYSTNNTTYTITLKGALNKVDRFILQNQYTISSFNFTNLCVKFSGLTYIDLSNVSGVAGSINYLPANIKELSLFGIGANLNGNLDLVPQGIESIQIYSANSITGSLPNIPTGIKVLSLRYMASYGGGSLNGLSQDLIFLRFVSMSNISGSISNLSANLTTLAFENIGTNVVINTTGIPAWPNCTITIQSGYNTASVDGFLINWANSVTGTVAKTINLAGANQARSSASDAAVTDLTTNHNKTIITN